MFYQKGRAQDSAPTFFFVFDIEMDDECGNLVPWSYTAQAQCLGRCIVPINSADGRLEGCFCGKLCTAWNVLAGYACIGTNFVRAKETQTTVLFKSGSRKVGGTATFLQHSISL